MQVKIRNIGKSAMQSGRALADQWVIEPVVKGASLPGSLMGWSGGQNTAKQIRLTFDTSKQAVDYAIANGWAYELQTSQSRKIKPKAYADNFSYTRQKPWTH